MEVRRDTDFPTGHNEFRRFQDDRRAYLWRAAHRDASRADRRQGRTGQMDSIPGATAPVDLVVEVSARERELTIVNEYPTLSGEVGVPLASQRAASKV